MPPFLKKNFSKSFKELNKEILYFLSNSNETETVTELMQQMYDFLRLSSQDLETRNKICSTINSTIQAFYPECSLSLFGSSHNGFGMKNSDMDLVFSPFHGYVVQNTPDMVKTDATINNGIDTTTSNNNDKVTNANGKTKQIEGIKLARFGTEEFSNNTLKLMSAKEHLLAVYEILLSDPEHFQNVLFIDAKCPILNFLYMPHSIVCDFSCQDKMVNHNTELQNLYRELDDRVVLLVMTIRNWASCLKLNLPGKFTSYATTLLVIFFLQNTEPPVLPSVKTLNELSDAPNDWKEWNFEIVKDIKKIPKSLNTQSAGELLCQFYKFYWDFDFKSYIVSPYLGKPLPIEDLKNSDNEKLKQFELSQFNVQDPFILDFNTCRYSNKNADNMFKPFIYAAWQVLSGPNVSSKQTFIKYFDRISYKTEKCATSEPVSPSFIIHPSLEQIFSKNNIKLPEDTWCHMTIHNIFELLHYGLLIESEVIDINGSSLEYKDLQSTIQMLQSEGTVIQSNEMNLKHLVTIQCVTYYRTWSKRHRIKIDEIPKVFENDVINLEHSISKAVLERCPNYICYEPILWFLCKCYKLKYGDQYSSIVVVLENLVKGLDFKVFKQFFKSYVLLKIQDM